MSYKCEYCGLSQTKTSDAPLPCSGCGKYQPVEHSLNQEDLNYLADFIMKTLQENDENDPFDLEEAEYLLELRKKLRA